MTKAKDYIRYIICVLRYIRWCKVCAKSMKMSLHIKRAIDYLGESTIPEEFKNNLFDMLRHFKIAYFMEDKSAD